MAAPISMTSIHHHRFTSNNRTYGFTTRNGIPTSLPTPMPTSTIIQPSDLIWNAMRRNRPDMPVTPPTIQRTNEITPPSYLASTTTQGVEGAIPEESLVIANPQGLPSISVQGLVNHMGRPIETPPQTPPRINVNGNGFTISQGHNSTLVLPPAPRIQRTSSRITPDLSLQRMETLGSIGLTRTITGMHTGLPQHLPNEGPRLSPTYYGEGELPEPNTDYVFRTEENSNYNALTGQYDQSYEEDHHGVIVDTPGLRITVLSPVPSGDEDDDIIPLSRT